jgi:hypothetical protein
MSALNEARVAFHIIQTIPIPANFITASLCRTIDLYDLIPGKDGAVESLFLQEQL